MQNKKMVHYTGIILIISSILVRLSIPAPFSNNGRFSGIMGKTICTYFLVIK
jgi:hypothetical protein